MVQGGIMKRSFMAFVMFSACVMLSAAGVVVNAILNPLMNTQARRCMYDVTIDNQIAIVTVREVFVNNSTYPIAPRYYFPLPDGASATQLRWFWNGCWLEANVTANSGGGSGVNELPVLYQNYLGPHPLKFDFNTSMLPSDSLAVELTYVQLLPYAYGNVDLLLRNNNAFLYAGQQMPTQSLNVSLHSARTITSFSLLSHTGAAINNTGHDASLHYLATYQPADTNYKVRYALSSEELGLWSMSTMTTNPPDNFGHGFFSFIVEPEPSDSIQIINKVFTLIIDRSGSMYGTKFQQAQAAATYIVNHLNEGDYFNIVSFASDVTPLWGTHHPRTPTNTTQAISYINNLTAGGSTNISGVFTTAVPQFSTVTDDTANIIIFLTDGQPTVGITNIPQLISHVDNLIQQTETGIFLFTFGIGSDVNPQLLSQLAAHNSGICTFLGDNDLNQTLTEFYNSIQNPVLLNPVFTVTPFAATEEIYPCDLPNLYLGKQLIVSGRYSVPQTATITFSGQAFNQQVSYQYPLLLREDSVSTYSFLPKLWAKQKIEKLLIDYYQLDPYSLHANEIKQEIINISIAYGVVCIFTQFSGGTPNAEETVLTPPVPVVLLGNYPNPFNQSTKISFQVLDNLKGMAVIRIYNIKGELVKVLALNVDSKGKYELSWDGTNLKGKPLPSGLYVYSLTMDNIILGGKMTLLR